MKQPLDLECPVEGWTRHHIFEYVTVPWQHDDYPSAKIPVMIYAWKDKKGEFYLSGETCAYLDQVKANAMGLFDCRSCDKQEQCDSKMVNACIEKSQKKPLDSNTKI